MARPARSTVALLFTASLAVFSACSESHSEPSGEPDAGISFEPPPPARDAGFDAGFDAGPGVPVGEECAEDADCGGDGGFCLSEGEGFAGGYCSSVCVTDDECPSGSACIGVGGGMSLCFDVCDPAATDRECRAFYGCASGLGIPMPVCIPGCTDDTDCPEGRSCRPTGGGSCFNPDAAFGDPCESSIDCADGQRCHSEARRGYPGGMCAVYGCDADANTGCPEGAHCVSGGRFGRCFPGCTVDTDCRSAYSCAAPETHPERLVCTPACTAHTDCTDGRACISATGECD